MFNRANFFRNTFAIFERKDPITTEKTHYVSKHGSKYIFAKNGVFRYSNHWGRVGNCRWRLEGIDYKQQTNFWGYCSWNLFFENKEEQAVFFIEQLIDGTYNYNHKGNASKEIVNFRNAKETAKAIQKLKEINATTQWAKHLPYDTIDVLRSFFNNKLLSTSLSFAEIQKEYLKDFS